MRSKGSYRRTRFYPDFTPAGGVRNQPQEPALGLGPAFVGYLETEVPGDNKFERTALTYPETDPSFVGYVTPGLNYQPHGPQMPSQLSQDLVTSLTKDTCQDEREEAVAAITAKDGLICTQIRGCMIHTQAHTKLLIKDVLRVPTHP